MKNGEDELIMGNPYFVQDPVWQSVCATYGFMLFWQSMRSAYGLMLASELSFPFP